MLDNPFSRMVGRASPSQSEHDPAFRIIHNDLTSLTDCIRQNTETMQAYLQREASLLDSYLVEGGTAGTVGASPFTFDAQTHDVELVTFILALMPQTAQSATLQLDDLLIPLPPGIFTTTECEIPVRKTQRIVSWSNVQATDRPFVLLCARPAPANIPGVLH